MLNFEEVKELAWALETLNPAKVYLVGGAVRDFVLGREVKDFDLEIYGVDSVKLAGDLARLAPEFGVKVNSVGASFQVFKFGLNVDISIPRRDTKVGEGHKGFEVTGDPSLSIEEASRRRDFTINSMLMNLVTGDIIDPFGGLPDLAYKQLRMVDKNTFVEDSLRALRAVQFASRFDLEITPETAEVIRGMDLSDLPRERVWGEFEKLLMQSPRPSVGLHLMQRLGINEKLFPELFNLEETPQEFEWHPEGNVFIHSTLAADTAKSQIGDLPYAQQVTVMLASLFHDLGKVETTCLTWKDLNGETCTDESCPFHDESLPPRLTATGHAEAGVSLARNMLDRFGLHSIDGYDVRGQVLKLVEFHMHPGQFCRQADEIKDSAFRRLSTKVDLNLLARVFFADSMSRNGNSHGIVFTPEKVNWFRHKVETLEIRPEGPERLLLGRHLLEMGMKPGKAMGSLLDCTYELQLEGVVTTLEEAKEMARRALNSDLNGEVESGLSPELAARIHKVHA